MLNGRIPIDVVETHFCSLQEHSKYLKNANENNIFDLITQNVSLQFSC